MFLLEFLHLAWEHTHGGIVSHHFLARADMPAISNAWGLILLPALTWFLAGRIQRRVALHSSSTAAKPEFPKSIVIGFVATLLFGAALSVAFVGGYKDITSYLFFGMLLSAVVLPVYRAECVLGFVLGMTLTFGAILPTIIGAIIATVSAALHLGVYPVIVRGWIWFRRT
ncbi:MAG: hypothetical protein JNN20_07125 [Betaproteobacteria bacterium]|nr:hypothetical protein [Betaproteobacteria bacterium]